MIGHYASIQATLREAERRARAAGRPVSDPEQVRRAVEQVSTSYAPSAPAPERHADASPLARAVREAIDGCPHT